MRICYVNITKEIPPRDKVYLGGLKENGHEIIECRDYSKSWRKFWHIFKKHRRLNNGYDVLWVGYTAHILVPFARLISRKKIVFNALGSMYEGLILSRQQAPKLSLKAARIWLIDLLAFHCANLNLVETKLQKEWLMKKFLLPESKVVRAWTGADENIFFFDPAIQKLPAFTVLFRGGFLPESGIEHALEAAKILENEDINFRIIGWGILERKVEEMIKKLELKNVEWMRNKLPLEELRVKMQECHLSLGQLSNHDRLNRTIPHKAFESIAMKIPYLTARNKGVLELLKENETCFCSNPADANDLAQKILELKNKPELRGQVVENAYQLYLCELTPNILAKKVLRVLKEI